ncbi:hypothetical protein N0V90_005474 [Kalmusia sp. IMI 367209]|nr:hypothetical protein N0V90_005474 [Kalmusia sp. IMI 367209]
MSKNLMDTEIGGENTQYEGSHTFVEPHDKQAGQLGGMSSVPIHIIIFLLSIRILSSHASSAFTYLDPDATTGTKLQDQVHKSASTGPNSQGVTPAEKLRYGQSIQEGGGGAGRTDASGQASSEGGFGGTEKLEADAGGSAQQRRAQGYGKETDMDQNIGA